MTRRGVSDADGQASGPPQPRGIGQSILAGAIGITVAVGLLGLGRALAARLTGWTFLFFLGFFVLVALVPGWVIGLLDRSRPFVTLMAAGCLASLAFIAAASFEDCWWPPEARHWPTEQGAIVWGARWDPWSMLPALIVAVVHLAIAAVGVGMGRSARSSARRIIIGSLSFASAFGVTVVLPWLYHLSEVRRVLTPHQSELESLIDSKLAPLPRLPMKWTWEPVDVKGGRAYDFRAAWPASTRVAGQGQRIVTVRIVTWSRLWGAPISLVEEMAFFYRPRRPALLESERDARQLLRELGVKALPKRLERSPGEWFVLEDPDGGPRSVAISKWGEVDLDCTPLWDAHFG